VAEQREPLVEHLLATDVLAEDNGLLWLGREGERRFGTRNFLDLMAVFSEAPVLKVLHGRTHLGQIPSRLLLHEEEQGHVILLAGRSWQVRDVDWKRGVAQVEPAKDRGKARWFGEGRGLSFELCQRIRAGLAGRNPEIVTLSQRAMDRLAQLREQYWWAGGDDTVLVRDGSGRVRWWTFAGLDANLWLSSALGDLRDVRVPRSDFEIRLRSDVTEDDLQATIEGVTASELTLADEIAAGAVSQLKFAGLLPDEQARAIVSHRLRADDAVAATLGCRFRSVQLAE
jgi:ATP-dependent helicase Lhr and Lhr-like helicase